MPSSKRRRKTLTQQSDVDDKVSVDNVSVYNRYKDPPYKEADLKSPSSILSLLKNSQTLTHRQVSSVPLPAAIRGRPPTVSGLGLVVGKLICRKREVVHDCSKGMGIGILYTTFMVEYMTADDALFILLVGNNSVLMMLAEDEFYNRFPCIIVSAEGPRDFLIKMHKDFKLPVLALVDSDPYWLKILAFYARKLNDIKWLGIRPSDAVTHKMEEELHLTSPMTKKDIKSCRGLFKDDFLKSRPEWLKELKIMLESKQKVEVETLCCFGYLYLSKVFLPMKLQQEDWI